MLRVDLASRHEESEGKVGFRTLGRFVEGLSDDRFAVISKIHHCMIDGSSGVDISQILMRLTPEREVEPPQKWVDDLDVEILGDLQDS